MDPILIFLILAFFFGTCVGSFLNVCIYRIPEKKSIVFPGSFCPVCRENIPFYCNIPIISFLILGGRCRSCRTRIPFRYPLVEIFTGCLAAAVAYKFGFSGQALVWFVFACTLTVVSCIDLDHQIIPDIISLPGTLIFGILGFWVLELELKSIVLGIITGGGILYAVAAIYFLVKKEQGMGGGDIKLMAMIGALTGIKGALFTIFAGSLLGSGIGILVLVSNKIINIRQKIPFGPFLSGGALLYLFFGDELIRWYFHTLSG
ncbi:prepilin peptidase [Desulfospira joergensenii]|uniref:prepilin peptidase n=1 Tax=Desulfospira joergensenii TaxID=53329 RepID=UPI0003B448B1|nr:A24 family peptidase [Desulfospira joergensenii]